jgi:hypothetical protein
MCSNIVSRTEAGGSGGGVMLRAFALSGLLLLLLL